VPCDANNHKPKVPAKQLKERGNLTGVWLIPFDALIAHLDSLPEGETTLDGNEQPSDRKELEQRRGRRTAPSAQHR
jgi:hypothetical protein